MTHGAAAIDELIEEAGWSYPVTVSRLERKYALSNVALDADGKHMIMVSELFLESDVDRFESRADLETKVEPVIQNEIDSRRTGVVGKLKRTFFARR